MKSAHFFSCSFFPSTPHARARPLRAHVEHTQRSTHTRAEARARARSAQKYTKTEKKMAEERPTTMTGGSKEDEYKLCIKGLEKFFGKYPGLDTAGKMATIKCVKEGAGNGHRSPSCPLFPPLSPPSLSLSRSLTDPP